jgi:putative transcriptional regulator
MTHPTIWYLTELAAGSLSSGMRLLVETHIFFCAPCWNKLRRLETVGGALLRSEPVQGSVALPDAARWEEERRRFCPEPAETGDENALPWTISRALGGADAKLPWRRVLPGLWDIRLPGDPGEDVRLLRARPGTRIIAHTHEGQEASLVITGQLRDGSRLFRRGDVSLCGPEHIHTPEIVGSEECLCLLVLGGRMRFTGRFARFLNLLAN